MQHLRSTTLESFFSSFFLFFVHSRLSRRRRRRGGRRERDMIIRCAPCGAGTPSDSIENLFDSNQVGERRRRRPHTHTHNFAHATTTTARGGEGKSAVGCPLPVCMISLFSCKIVTSLIIFLLLARFKICKENCATCPVTDKFHW